MSVLTHDNAADVESLKLRGFADLSRGMDLLHVVVSDGDLNGFILRDGGEGDEWGGWA